MTVYCGAIRRRRDLKMPDRAPHKVESHATGLTRIRKIIFLNPRLCEVYEIVLFIAGTIQWQSRPVSLVTVAGGVDCALLPLTFFANGLESRHGAKR